ncbi:hypothetical protein GCM10010995_06260 [Cysteiniphilum litorale]|uniref:Uncharacterized protein n=1 Tax=Cysteiniphilum litorale TaxID=2056700 RepID=A0A8J3E8J1_9GAMM|nr:hypothetical protein GCM10010995_06260 [Cysteiniphilum litorale]
MVLKQKVLMSRTMKNSRMDNDSRLDVLKKIMRQKLGAIKQDRNNKTSKLKSRKNESTRKHAKTKKSQIK